MAARRIALGLTLGREMDSTIFMRWLELTRSHWWPGPIYNGRAAYTVQARNIVLMDAFRELDKWDSLLFWDSDQLPPLTLPRPEGPQFFTEYLSTLEEPVVGGLYYNRDAFGIPAKGEKPHDPVAYDQRPDGTFFPLQPDKLVPWLFPEGRGLHEIGGVGTGAMLIRQDVLTRLRDIKAPRAIFEAPEDADHPGLQWTEDLYFCHQVRELLGEKVYLDTAAESAHGATIWIHSAHYLAARGMTPQKITSSKPASGLVGPDGRPLN